jgi:hypothetical protein
MEGYGFVRHHLYRLGMLINMIGMHFVVSEKKVSKLQTIQEIMLNFPKIHTRKLAKLAGFINCLSLALWPITRMFS